MNQYFIGRLISVYFGKRKNVRTGLFNILSPRAYVCRLPKWLYSGRPELVVTYAGGN